MISGVALLVTGADNIQRNDSNVRRERYIEYMLSLHKLFSYNIPVYGVLSECNHSVKENVPPFEQFPFRILTKIEAGHLNNYTKSQKEFASISKLLHHMKDQEIEDETFIIKCSGRYLIINDLFVATVQKNVNNSDVNAIIKLCDDGVQQYTFLYALRYKYFKKFFEKDVHTLGYKNIEQIALEFLIENDLMKTTIVVNTLGILTNINNEGLFRIY